MKITRAEVDLICAGFVAVDRDRDAAARSFYAHLFAIAPDTRGLFVTDLDRQGAKLIDTLAAIVAQVDNWGLLRTALEDMALRHTAYGVRPEHYAPVGDALLAMLKDRIGPEFSPELAALWRRVYDAVQAAMISTAYREPAVDRA